jgi:dCTP deaminase
MSETPAIRSGFLSADDFRALSATNPNLSSPAPKAENVKGASVDLTVGDVFLPCAEPGKLGGPDRPRTYIDLKQGETAVIRTLEKLSLPTHVGAICFPPATLSLKGMLTTNPGHVDPGYQGHLHLTVINMSRKTLHLERGMRIMRLLLFWNPGTAICSEYPNPITDELLERLSPDFLDIKDRAERAASYAVLKQQLLVPIIAAAVAAILSAGATYFASLDAQKANIADIEKRITRIDGQINPQATTASLQVLDARLKKLEEKTPEAPPR